MSVTEDTWGVPGSKQHTPAEVDEHAVVSSVSAKKVFNIVLHPLAQTNPSFVLSYTGSNLTTVEMVISGTTYTKTLGYDGSDNLTTVSVWS